MAGYITGITIGSITLAIAMIFLILNWWKKRSIKKLVKRLGTAAEISINSDIKIWSKHTKNKFINSSIYKYGENKVFEIDSILITSKALIIIEIKSIKGAVEGEASNPTWSKVLGTVKHPISNPIIQNDKHIEHVIKMTNNRIPTISLIVFSDRTKNINIDNMPPHVVVTRHADLFDTLDDIERSLQPVMNEEQIKMLYDNIKSFRATKKEDIRLHERITQKGRV